MPALSIPRILPRVQDPSLEFRKYLNLLLSLGERRRNEERLRARPFELTIDPATLCQLRCPYCETGNGTLVRSRGAMKPELHRSVMSELGEDLFVVWYFSTGEPLLNKDLARIVAETKGKEIFSTISTNLSLPLSDDRIDELLTCGLSCISVSLDGACEETYVQYRRRGRFDLVVDNLKRLVARKRALGLAFPLIEWRFLVFAHNHHEIPEVRRLAAEWGVDLLELFPGVTPPDPAPGEVAAAPEGLALDPAHEGVAFEQGLARRETTLDKLLAREPAPVVASPPTALRGAKCDWLYFGAAIFPNGSLSPCCVSNNEPDDFGLLDDLHGFSDSWNNAHFRDARARFDGAARGDDLICARCPIPESQDFQFITTLRGLLRNAPDWALKVLARDPDRFFHPLDFELMPQELSLLREGRIRVRSRFPDQLARLDERIREEADHPDLPWIREALARSGARESRFGAQLARWLPDLSRRRAETPPESTRDDESESRQRALAPLLDDLVWSTNPMPAAAPDSILLHLGAGGRRLPGFVPIEVGAPASDALVWKPLDPWPAALAGRVTHAFAESFLERFFYGEQVYLLSYLNQALQDGGVLRLLTPNLQSLIEVSRSFDPESDFLARSFGVETGADALNLGLRFGAHRWLHDAESLPRLAELCGFVAHPTSCHDSRVPELKGINRQDEGNSLAFAHDLEKCHGLQTFTVEASKVTGAEPCGELVPGLPLYRSTSADPQVHYELPLAVPTHELVLLVVRGSNLTRLRADDASEAYLVQRAESALPIDRSLCSTLHSAMLPAPLLRARTPAETTSSIRFDPARRAGDFFTLGPAEVHVRDLAAP